MYYYGLCLRNGYGVKINADSAKYWLSLSANLGNPMSKDELMLKEPENIGEAGKLSQKIQAAQSTLPKTHIVNKYQKVQNRVDINEVEGNYYGYLLKYDWSGEHIVEADEVKVTLERNNDSLRGIWKENDSLIVPINAFLSSNSITFKQMSYSKTNHYSPNKAELAVFKKANLQLDKIGDSVYLSGNIQQYIPSRKEPAKPLFLALERIDVSHSKPMAKTDLALHAYPNPFGSNINMDFELKETCNVVTQILTLDGKVVYNNSAGLLAAGSYILPIQTQQVATGYYILALHYGQKVSTTKIIKL